MSVKVMIGDCRDVLKTLPDASVHCCVTSLPYFGLRDYGMAAQIGLEQTPDAFVAELVAVFREVRRVLRDDGTLFLNIGDSYNSIGHKKSGSGYGSTGLAGGKAQEHTPLRRENTAPGLKHKDLIGIPWRLAFALQADGWYLRQDIIWSKPNPMPESVTDRCTKAHEYVFLLSKSQTYYCDMQAIAEPLGAASVARLSQPGLAEQAGSDRVPGKTNGAMKAVGTRRPSGNVNPQKGGIAYAAGDEKHRTKEGLLRFAQSERAKVEAGDLVGTRNKRSVWTIATQPFAEAHFATMAPELAETCIKAGCPPGGTVLDPFGGAGTTGLVADRLQRSAILIELNPDYGQIAERRITGDAPLFVEMES